MRKLSVVNFITLDGVMQSPADPDEDRSGGFEYGGWVQPYLDEDWGRAAGEGWLRLMRFSSGGRPTRRWLRTGRTSPTTIPSPSR